MQNSQKFYQGKEKRKRETQMGEQRIKYSRARGAVMRDNALSCVQAGWGMRYRMTQMTEVIA